MIVAGVDIGSLTAKAILLDEEEIIGSSLVLTGSNSIAAGRKALDLALEDASVREGEVRRITATGYGRLTADFAADTVTEITCHAKGAHHLFEDVRTVIDLGGQDSKAISVGEKGKVTDFVMNDKCAAGTGRFLEVMAHALEVPLEELGALALQSETPASVSSVCTVFAESEVISRVAEGTSRVDIIGGIVEAITSRIYAMVRRLGLEDRVVMTGGVALNQGVVKTLGKKMHKEIYVPSMPQHVGALGAALIALARSREDAG